MSLVSINYLGFGEMSCNHLANWRRKNNYTFSPTDVLCMHSFLPCNTPYQLGKRDGKNWEN